MLYVLNIIYVYIYIFILHVKCFKYVNMYVTITKKARKRCNLIQIFKNKLFMEVKCLLKIFINQLNKPVKIKD